MAAAVVYDGAGSGGTLFQGMKFWIAQRVPSRSRWIELVTANGGEIVKLEQLADIMIADHARKDARPGTYSWTYLEKSVKNGRLENLGDHRAGPVEGTVRDVGSAQPTRGARTAFTPADDRLLAEWVRKAEKQGLSTKGNSIYKQLERINPRHTFQSWRDRWIKYGQFLSRPDIIEDDATPVSAPERSATTHTSQRSPNNSPSQYASSSSIRPPHGAQTRRDTSPVPPRLKPSSGQPFTKADFKLLMMIYDDIMNIDESRLIEAWQAFAERNPQHTAHEWYEFWSMDVKPKGKSQPRKPNKSTSPVRSTKASSTPTLAASQMSPNELIAHPEIALELSSETRHKNVEPLLTTEARFRFDLVEFAEGQNIEIDFYPIVSGHKIRLFDLWNIVESPEFGGFENVDAFGKWAEVGTRLDFKESTNPSAPTKLREIYESILADFSDAQYLKSLRKIIEDGGDLTEAQVLDIKRLSSHTYEGLSEEDELREQEAKEDFDDDLETSSSLPQRVWFSQKRAHPVTSLEQGQGEYSQHTIVTQYKRQRIDKGKGKMLEIPSTPEDLLTFDGQAHDPSSLKGHTEGKGNGEEAGVSTDDEDSMFVGLVERKVYSSTIAESSSKALPPEPETQDFHYSYPIEQKNTASQSQQTQEDASGAGESVAAVAGSVRDDSSTQSQTDSQREEAELRAFLDHHVSLGYSEKVVTEAMLATTLETGDAATVMDAITQGHGIPENIQGVWTAKDDRAVRLTEDNEVYERVVAKHGEARCVKRRQFLSDLERA